MAYQTTFQRRELKYLLTRRQRCSLLRAMDAHMRPDEYGRSGIRNLYYDTPSFRLARASLEKPVYKEKLRVRSYGADGPVFVELKKKYKSVVYKRRVALPQQEALDWLGGVGSPEPSQIVCEIDYFRDYYGDLEPQMFLSYTREAFYSRLDDGFRLTLDENLRFRTDDLRLDGSSSGTPLIPEDTVLLELKTPGGLPLWMVHFLTEQRIFQTSFSKYGLAYQRLLSGSPERGRLYA